MARAPSDGNAIRPSLRSSANLVPKVNALSFAEASDAAMPGSTLPAPCKPPIRASNAGRSSPCAASSPSMAGCPLVAAVALKEPVSSLPKNVAVTAGNAMRSAPRSAFNVVLNEKSRSRRLPSTAFNALSPSLSMPRSAPMASARAVKSGPAAVSSPVSTGLFPPRDLIEPLSALPNSLALNCGTSSWPAARSAVNSVSNLKARSFTLASALVRPGALCVSPVMNWLASRISAGRSAPCALSFPFSAGVSVFARSPRSSPVRVAPRILASKVGTASLPDATSLSKTVLNSKLRSRSAATCGAAGSAKARNSTPRSLPESSNMPRAPTRSVLRWSSVISPAA